VALVVVSVANHRSSSIDLGCGAGREKLDDFSGALLQRRLMKFEVKGAIILL
jgi:hypothetical protein